MANDKPTNKQSKSLPKAQKYRWSKKKIFDTFEEADSLRNKLKTEGALTKVRRCGPGGTRFKVIVGTEIKADKKKKGESNASE